MRARRGALAMVALAALGAPAAARAEHEPLRFRDLDGAPVEVSPPAGDGAVVIHYWATWCPQCGPELAGLAAAAEACAGTAVRVLAVDVDEPAERVRAFLAEHGLALEPLLDPGGRSWRRTGGRELPANLIWTARGRRHTFGPRDEATWRAELATLGCGGGAATP
ncbi:MAG TPA: TlpA disulfide reductase family protein [Myxococcota bacterium]